MHLERQIRMAKTISKDKLPLSLQACCEALLAKKALNITVIDVKGVSTITDYYVVATGESSPQLRAMAESSRMALKERAESTGLIDGDPASGWVVMDAFEFVVHLFLRETRDHYAIESLWKDRARLVVTD
jgi:ribosome-associated protein